MRRYTWRTGLLEVGMVLAGLLFMVPVYLLVNIAIRPVSSPDSPLVPTTTPTLENFTTVWVSGDLGRAMLNSLAVTILSLVFIIAISALASYPLARISSWWSRGVYLLFMIGLLLPFQLGFIPLYQTLNSLNLLGTIWSLVLLYAGHQVPFTTFLYVSFLRALPQDYEAAALIDGCVPFQAFTRVVFPLLRPVTATVVILNVILIWNDFMSPLLYLGGSENQTIPVAIYGFVNEWETVWPVVFAGLIIGLLPVLAAFFALQGRIMQGFSLGTKG